MRFISIIWDDETNPNGNVQHIAEHELAIEDVEHVLRHPSSEGISRNRAGRLISCGYTPDGRYIAVIYEEVIEGVIRVRTAYDVQEP